LTIRVQNDWTRFHLVHDALTGYRAWAPKRLSENRQMETKLIEHKHYIDKTD